MAEAEAGAETTTTQTSLTHTFVTFMGQTPTTGQTFALRRKELSKEWRQRRKPKNRSIIRPGHQTKPPRAKASLLTITTHGTKPSPNHKGTTQTQATTRAQPSYQTQLSHTSPCSYRGTTTNNHNYRYCHLLKTNLHNNPYNQRRNCHLRHHSTHQQPSPRIPQMPYQP